MLDKQNPVLRPYRQNNPSSLTAKDLAEQIFGEEGLLTKVEARWDAYEKHQEWVEEFLKKKDRGPEPTFTHEDTGEVVSGARALDPCPPINETLSGLVNLCIDSYEEGVVQEFFEIVRNSAEYSERIKKIPLISSCSEAEMEKYFANAALTRIEERHNGGFTLSPEAMSEIKGTAEKRVKDYLEKTGSRFRMQFDEHEGIEIAVPADGKDEELTDSIQKARKLFRLDETIKPFPYTHNYEHLAYGEQYLIENPAGHGNFPQKLQKLAQKIALPADDPEGKTQDAKQIKSENPDIFGVEDLQNKHMTFVGSGALPLTGFVNHILTGCKVNLIDVDSEAIELSQKLRNYLETLGVLERDAVKVYIRDANQVYFGGPREDSTGRVQHRGKRLVLDRPHYEIKGDKEYAREREDLIYMPTDILYIASLIPNDIKRSVMRNLEENMLDPVPVTIVRSARGLSSMLYEPIHEGKKDIIGASPYYHDYGSIVPKRHTVPYGNPHTAVSEGYISPVSITALVSDDNINTAHIYHRSAMPLVNPHAVFLPGSKFDEQLKKDFGQDGDEVDYSYLAEHGPALLRQMKQELERYAESKGVEIDTSFLDPEVPEKAQTSEALIETYRSLGRQYTEAKQQISR